MSRLLDITAHNENTPIHLHRTHRYFVSFRRMRQTERRQPDAPGHHCSRAKMIADIDGVATIINQTGKAVITSQQFGEIIIEPSCVSFGRTKWTDIPRDAPITLNFSRNKYSVQWTTSK